MLHLYNYKFKASYTFYTSVPWFFSMVYILDMRCILRGWLLNKVSLL